MITWLLSAVLLVLYAAICKRDVRLGLFVFAAVLPSYLLRLNLFGIPTTLLELFFGVLAVAWFWQARVKKSIEIRDPGQHLGLWLPAILVLLVAASVSLFMAPDLMGALGIWKAYFLEPIILFLIARSLLRNQEDVGHLIDALGVGALFVAVIGVGQYIFGTGLPTPWDVERRITSIFPYPNAVGLYLGPIIVLGISRLRGTAKRLWLLTIPFALLAVFFAQSEAAWVALAATGIVAGLWYRKTRMWTGAVVVAGLIGLALLPGVRGNVIQKITLHDYSGEVRRTQWEETVALLKDYPIFGAGLSGYPTALVPYHTHPHYEIFQYPHNTILNIWVELGLLGVIALFLFIISVVRTIWPTIRHRAPATCYLLPATFTLLEIAIHGLVDVPYFKNDLAMLTWLLFAILSLSLYVESRTQPS